MGVENLINDLGEKVKIMRDSALKETKAMFYDEKIMFNILEDVREGDIVVKISSGGEYLLTDVVKKLNSHIECKYKKVK
ncbi:MAG: hypothetical protein PHZ19_04040 [Candidatus Thermoplasmatota archaeon]|nr:hypothetical protein [Candidatus Thermoplasmatota archaeon]